MADIEVICTSCSNKMTVSEHVDIELLKCRKCGSRMGKSDSAVAAAAAAPAPKAQLKTAASDPAPASTPAPVPAATPAPETPSKTGNLKLRNRESKPAPAVSGNNQSVLPTEQQPTQVQPQETVVMQGPSRMHMWKAMGVGILLAAIAWFIRYSGMVSPDILGMVKDWGPFLAGALYIFITITAFKDGMFSGVLCVLIPFYPFYYVFAVADDFYLRAVTVATLILTGQDSATFYGAYANLLVDIVNEFIRTGGG